MFIPQYVILSGAKHGPPKRTMFCGVDESFEVLYEILRLRRTSLLEVLLRSE